MHIEAVDVFYLSMPSVLDIGDGSQDALLVRVQAGPYVGWGECEASPLVSIASLVCPMSHSACKPVIASVLGQQIDDVADIARISANVRRNSADLLQADHTLSGIDIALWDLLGKRLDVPVYALLGYQRAYPKIAYASALFGDTPEHTFAKALRIRTHGYRAAKFGWGPFGCGSVADDAAQVMAAREGFGPDGMLLIDAGMVWEEDVDAAAARSMVLRDAGVVWLEEPFIAEAWSAHRALAPQIAPVQLAGGERCNTVSQALHMIEHAQVGFIQIDAGRIGGISAAYAVASAAAVSGVTFVNHTFTSHLALSASLQPYAGLAEHRLCEYPVELQPLALALTQTHILPNADGEVCVPEVSGLGMEPDADALAQYLVDVEIRVQNRILYRTPPLTA
jgi:L-alanine-DL-glutamate epimerase-like enolase superfamily enzyme